MLDSQSFASRTVSALSISAIKDMAMRAAKLDDVASLAWGLPSFRTPEHIRSAVHGALDKQSDAGKYTLPDGLPQFREIIAETHANQTGIHVSPDRQIIATAGNMEAVKVLLGTVLAPGDEVVVTDPGFASHIQQIRMCGGEPVAWRLDEEDGWSLDIGTLDPLITARTRALLLVTPSNPTGKIFAEDALRRVAEIVKNRGLLLILDDPYSHFTYENRDCYFNPASDPDLSEHVSYLFTFSKCHAMSGWRVGYAIVPEALKAHMLKVHDATLICAPRVSQIAATAALRGNQEHVQEFERVLERRRALICERLDRLPHVFSYVKPDGAYYVFPRILVEHESDRQFALDLLHNSGVCVTPGSAFGSAGGHHVRMAFCGEDDEINRAFDRIQRDFPE